MLDSHPNVHVKGALRATTTAAARVIGMFFAFLFSLVPAEGRSMPNNRPDIPGLFVSNSSKMQRALDAVHAAASSRASVLITGENGTGKGVLAHYLHLLSNRSGGFVTVDTTLFPKELMESELYGMVPRFLDSRHPGKAGLVHTAHQGTLFFDEIGDMPLEQQPKLLRFCQEHSFRRVGSNQDEHVDVRCIFATNQCLETRIRSGHFRPDLFYRIRDIRIHLPPLRERREDIEPLALHFLALHAQLLQIPIPVFSDDLMRFFLEYEWPGNLRELASCIRMLVEDEPSHGGVLTITSLPEDLRGKRGSRSAPACVHGASEPQNEPVIDASTPAQPSNPAFQRVPRNELVHEVLTQYLLPKRVVALLQTQRGGGRTLARQLAPLCNLPALWLIDSSCERTEPELFYRRLTRDERIQDQVHFECWLRERLRRQGSLLLILTQPSGPAELLEEVAATVRGLLADSRGLHFLIVGGERLLRLRSHERYSWLRLLPPGSLFNVPDLFEADVARLLRGHGLPAERAAWVHRQTGGHPWLVYELLSQDIETEEAALQEVKYQLRQSHSLDRHLQDPEAVEVLRRLLREESVASLADPAICRNPERYAESRLYFQGLLVAGPSGTRFRCPAAQMMIGEDLFQ